MRTGRQTTMSARALIPGANFGSYLFVAQFLQSVVGLSSAKAGFAFLPTTIGSFIVAISAPRLIGRYGAGTVLVVSVATGLISMIWLSFAMRRDRCSPTQRSRHHIFHVRFRQANR